MGPHLMHHSLLLIVALHGSIFRVRTLFVHMVEGQFPLLLGAFVMGNSCMAEQSGLPRFGKGVLYYYTTTTCNSLTFHKS